MPDSAPSTQGVTIFGHRMPDRIPPLSGWFLKFYYVVFAICLVASVTTVIPTTFRGWDSGFKGRLAINSLGIEPIGTGGNEMLVAPLVPSVARLGVRHGDVLLAIDAKPLDTELSDNRFYDQFHGPSGKMVRLTLRHADGSQQLIGIPRSGAYVRQAYDATGITFDQTYRFGFICFSVFLVAMWTMSILLVWRRAREPVAAMLAFGITFALLPLVEFGFPLWVYALQGIVMYVSTGLGLSLFPDSRFISRVNWLVVAVVVLLSVISAVGLFYTPLQVSVFVINFFLFAMIGWAVIIRYRRTPEGTERQQLKFFALGLFILVTCMVAASLLGIFWRPPAWGAVSWRQVINGPLFMLGFTSLSAGIVISMLRYRLYDADRTISRSIAIGALSLALVGIFTLSERLDRDVWRTMAWPRSGRMGGGGVGAAIAAIMIVPLHRRLDHWAEKRFQTKLTRFRDDYPALVGDLRETMTPQAIANDLLDRALPVLKVDRGIVLLGLTPIAKRQATDAEFNDWRKDRDPPEVPGLYTDEDDPLLPTRLSFEAPGHGRIGWLLLGPRPDGSSIGKDEREALTAIADPLARALNVAQNREARRSEDRSILNALKKRIDKIEHQLST